MGAWPLCSPDYESGALARLGYPGKTLLRLLFGGLRLLMSYSLIKVFFAKMEGVASSIKAHSQGILGPTLLTISFFLIFSLESLLQDKRHQPTQ